MGVISAKLDQLEAHLRTLIEGRMARLLPTLVPRDDLIQRLVSAMQTGTQVQEDGSSLAPDVYVLLVHPDLSPGMLTNQPLLEGLAGIIREAGTNTGLRFARPPVVNVSPNPEVETNQITIIARTSLEAFGETAATPTQQKPNVDNIPSNAFLIVNGMRIFPLDRSLIHIGRRSDNDLVIDDPRISRAHAQLRAIRGQYVLFDLDSKGGTFVNGQRISHCTLHPRDVISLAGIPLVYGQDDADPLGETQRYVPQPISGEEQPTKDHTL